MGQKCSDRRYGRDFNLQFGQCQLGDLHDDAGWTVFTKIFQSNVGDLMAPNIGYVDCNLHDVLHVRLVGDENNADVLERLNGLRSKIVLPHNLARSIERDLARHKKQWAAPNPYGI
jgi:hypothetical protein